MIPVSLAGWLWKLLTEGGPLSLLIIQLNGEDFMACGVEAWGHRGTPA